jgi:putative endonuclease
MYYCYLARCNDGSLYCGYCKDINEREDTHNEGAGAKYTRARLPINIVYFEVFQTRSAAMKREAEIKKWKKEKKEELIKVADVEGVAKA